MSSSITLNHPNARRGPSTKLLAVIGAVVALVAIGVALLVVSGNDDKGKLTGSNGANFSLSYPDGWKELSAKELGSSPGSPIAGVRSGDSSGFVFVRREGRAPKNFNAFSTQFT